MYTYVFINKTSGGTGGGGWQRCRPAAGSTGAVRAGLGGIRGIGRSGEGLCMPNLPTKISSTKIA